MNPYKPEVDHLSVYERIEIETPAATLDPEPAAANPDHFEPYKGLCEEDLIDEDALAAGPQAEASIWLDAAIRNEAPARHVSLLEVFNDDDGLFEELLGLVSHARASRARHRHQPRV
jgi:hypothetical protein